ncbi:MAG: quinol:cytochrome C oxidoreductase, partial [Thermoguttaceae bacterium]
VRRLNEILAANMPLMAVLFLPLAVSLFLPAVGPYVWANSEFAARSALVQHKEPYLNVSFFLARSLVYLGLWVWMARFYFTRSVRQDRSGDPQLTVTMERYSGPILLLYGVTITFAAFDWLMSIDPEWFSSIFGVYFYSGATVGGLAAVILVAIVSQRLGYANDAITTEHYHDLGKLLFSFVIFWGYIAFSQYMLIWYANIPEETRWYLDRQTPAWSGFSIVLLVGHLFIPFFGLISRVVKRRKGLLGFWCVWLLVLHWFDMCYLVMPAFSAERFPIGLIDVCLLVGLGGLYVAGTVRAARGVALVATRDPRLAEALSFENI